MAGKQGQISKPSKVTSHERLQWAHDAMMIALRRAAASRADLVLTTAAFARMQEYDTLLAASVAEGERKRREAQSRARREGALKRYYGDDR